MRELSLHILDIAQNSIAAKASLVQIRINEQPESDLLTISVTDDGCGMDPELLKHAADPFTTTRSTRKVGLGIPLLEAGAARAGGGISVTSEVGKGTKIEATYQLNHIDRAPLGDVAETVATLVFSNPEGPDFLFSYRVGDREYDFDTREVKKALGGLPLSLPEVMAWARDNLKEGIQELHGGA